MPRITLGGGRTVRTFTSPPKDFDPITASNSDRLKHGFPALPDHPKHLEMYKRLFGVGNGFRYIEPEFSPSRKGPHTSISQSKLTPASPKLKPVSPKLAPPLVIHQNNPIWSGASCIPFGGETIGYILGQFTVPNVNALGTGDYLASIWLGIDGDSYNDNAVSKDVCQAGVRVSFSRQDGHVQQSCTVFMEWFQLGQPVGSAEIQVVFPVTFGDLFGIIICATPSLGVPVTEAMITFINFTQFARTSMMLDAPPGTSLRGDSAEWIVERPQFTEDGSFALLPNYGEVIFTGCEAISYTPDGSLSSLLTPQFAINMQPTAATSDFDNLSNGISLGNTTIQCLYLAPGNGVE